MNTKDTTTAMDELHSHLTPAQFSYLLSILARSSSSASASHTEYTKTGGYSSDRGFSPSASPGDSSSDSDIPPGRRRKDNAFYGSEKSPSFASDSVGVTTSIMHDKRWRAMNDKDDTGGKVMLQLPLRKYSIATSAKSKSTAASATPWNDSRRVSMLALKSCASHDDDDQNEWNVGRNVEMAESTYSKVPLPVVKWQGGTIRPERSATAKLPAPLAASCSDLPVCKKIMGRYAICTMSRSSSTESVYAESLPDPDNPLVSIAGKIANEPVNPFPVLRMPPPKKLKKRPSTTLTDITRIESEVDREIRKFQDFRNVSDFFRNGLGDPSKKKSSSSSKRHNYTRRVTNPLYKEYDPSGYQKSEDELALECIQNLCNDFNSWTRSLVTPNGGEEEDVNDQQHDTNEIRPDFLIQILRKDLELPQEGNEI